MLDLTFSYFFWHYTKAYKEMFLLSKSFISFIYHFFGVRNLALTLFSPWQKLDEPYPGGFHIEATFEALVVNTLMRIIGFLIRICTITIAIIFISIAVVFSICIFIVWTFLPFIIILLFISGLRMFVK